MSSSVDWALAISAETPYVDHALQKLHTNTSQSEAVSQNFTYKSAALFSH